MVIHPPNDGFRTINGTDIVVFLAGPIQGAPNWQALATELLDGEDVVIANPRSPEWHQQYYEQVEWETHHLLRAAARGVILFWCAKEDKHTCDRAYAQTTRLELGEWLTRQALSKDKINLALGVEPGFTNERYIRHRLRNRPMHISSTLDNTCAIALQMIAELRADPIGIVTAVAQKRALPL